MIFVLILLVLFKRPLAVSLIFGLFMLVFYIPTGYYIDLDDVAQTGAAADPRPRRES